MIKIQKENKENAQPNVASVHRMLAIGVEPSISSKNPMMIFPKKPACMVTTRTKQSNTTDKQTYVSGKKKTDTLW